MQEKNELISDLLNTHFEITIPEIGDQHRFEKRAAKIMKFSKFQQYSLLILICGITFWIFLPGLRGGFIWDDATQIRDNPFLDNWMYFWKILSSSLREYTNDKAAGPLYRPTMIGSYFVLNQIFGKNPLYFHLYNLGLHLLNGWLLFLIIKNLNKSFITSLLATVVFLIHPLVAEGVVWIASLQDLYSLLFPLLVFLLVIKEKYFQWFHWILFSALLFLAFISKEINVALFIPLTLLLLHISRKNEIESKKKYGIFFSYVVVMFLYFFIRQKALGSVLPQEHQFSPSMFGHIINFFFIFVKLYLLPLVQKFNRPYTLEDFGIFDLIFSSVTTILIIYYCLRQWLREKDVVPIFGLAISIYVLIPLPMIVLTSKIFAERYMYTPVAGFSIILSVLLENLFAHGSHKLSKATICFVTIVIIFFGYQNHQYSKHWINDDSMFDYLILHPPYTYEVPYHFGVLAVQKHDYQKATGLFAESIRLNSNNPQAINNLGAVFLSMGEPEKASKTFEKLVEISPSVSKYQFNLGLSYYHSNQKMKAKEAFEKCLQLDPDYPRAAEYLKLTQPN